MSLYFLEVISLLLASLTALLAIIYLKNKQRHITHWCFCLLITSFSVENIHDLLNDSDIISPFAAIAGLNYAWPPLFYLYIHGFIRNARNFRNTDLLHFIPSAIALLIFFYIGTTYQGVEYQWLITLSWAPTFFATIDIVLVSQFALYLGLSIDTLRRYVFWLNDNYSTTEQSGVIWTNRLVVGIFTIFTINFLLFGINMPIFDIAYPEFFYDIFQFVTLLVAFWAVLYAWLNPDIFICNLRYVSTGRKTSNDSINQILDKSLANHDILEAQLLTQIEALNQVMHQIKPYRDPSISLTDLAKLVNLTPRSLSQLLNQALNQSFYNYVNYFRLKEVEKRLSDPANKSAKLEGIAIDSGFRSTSTFNRLFKQHANMTPQQYREQKLNR